MTPHDRTDRFCVVGAGSSGLVAAKHLRHAGVAVDIVEREDDVGGNWYYGKPRSSICASTRTISSKRLTEYTDFPMPADWPEYPHHSQIFKYLRDYARHFGLYELVEFNRAIKRIEPAGEHWDVTLDGGETRRYAGVVIANGHNWDPRWPDFPGKFSGTLLHSADYKTPDVLRGRRVLVVGAGNSGCDIAVESAREASQTFLSVRRGYHYLPKFLLGKPADQVGELLLRMRLPLPLRRFVAGLVLRVAAGPPQRFGLPKPDHKLFETHPIINSQLLYHLGHGQITPKPDVERLCGDRVRFADGSEEELDVIVCATGFNITFPFIKREHLNWSAGRPDLYLNVFHPDYDNLFVIGLIQPDSGQFGLVDYQSQLVARFVAALRDDPAAAERFRRLKSSRRPDLSRGIRYLDSPRHRLEVEHFSYRRRLQRDLARFR